MQKFVLEKINQGLSIKTIKDIVIVLKMIIKFAQKLGLFCYRQINIKFPQQKTKTELKVLSKTDHKKIMKYVYENFTFKNFGICLCLSTGMRIGEVCGLLWKDIDLQNQVLVLKHMPHLIQFVLQKLAPLN